MPSMRPGMRLPRILRSLADGSDMISGWQEFDLSSLGKVSKLTFNLECSTNNGYGMSLLLILPLTT